MSALTITAFFVIIPFGFVIYDTFPATLIVISVLAFLVAQVVHIGQYFYSVPLIRRRRGKFISEYYEYRDDEIGRYFKEEPLAHEIELLLRDPN